MSESNPLVSGYLSMMRKAWSGRLEIPIEWLGRSSGPEDIFSDFFFRPISDLLHSLGEEQIKPIRVEERTIQMSDIDSPCPDFLEPWRMSEDVENEVAFEMKTCAAFMRCAALIKFPFGARSNTLEWSLAMCMTMHMAGFFTNVPGTMNRESKYGTPLTDPPSENASGIQFAVMINRYGSRPHSAIYGFHGLHQSPNLADQSLNRACFMRITQTHPALIVGTTEDTEKFTPMNKQRILDSLAPLVEPSLLYLVDGWRQYCLQNDLSIDEPFPRWLIVFSLVSDPEQVTIIAHYPASPNLRTFNDFPSRFSPLVLDSIHSHLSVEMSPENTWKDWDNPLSDTNDWIYDRLRLGVALLRILKNSVYILAMWDELRWSSDTLLGEEEYDKKMANWRWRTPNPSETSEDVWVESLKREEREAFRLEQELETEAIRAVYGEDVLDVSAGLVSTSGTAVDDEVPKVPDSVIGESINRVSLWFERLPKDMRQFDPLPDD